MKEQNDHKKSTSIFLKSDGEKTKSNQIQIPSISLPKGGGAIKSIDEKFSVNAINGTAAFSIPIPVSDARGFSPSLTLNYNSGAGNGPFGLGWSLNLLSLRRKTEKELPQYYDAADSDTYLMSEAEDLVPEYRKDDQDSFEKGEDGNYVINEFPSMDDKSNPIDENFIVRRYRPRIEGTFARIERWTHKTSRNIHWRVVSKDNVTTIYGKSSSCRITDPNDDKKIFEWLIEFSYDDKGHCILYEYKQEDGKGIDLSKLHNKNRFDKKPLFTNTYLKRIQHGNLNPYNNHGDPIPDKWMCEIVFDYGEHELDLPYDEIKDWDFRPDAFSDYRSGFEIRTCRLCKRVLLYHHFTELPGGSALVKTLALRYSNNGEEGFSFLSEATLTGYTKQDDGIYTQKSLPPFSFEYQKHEWNNKIESVSSENMVHAPSGIDEQQYQFIDLFDEGLSGILTEQANGWYYKHNLGDGNFEQAKLVSPKPSFTGLGNQLQLVDLDADGGKQLANLNVEPKGFFELTDEEDWQPFRNFENLPNVNLRDVNSRLIDLNGDGKADLLITEDNVFTCYESAGRKGFVESYKTVKQFNEEEGPHVIFSDPAQSIFLADMSGDGMTDIVRIRNGEVCYWPNLGYGRFGMKVGMDHAPVFDHPDAFNPSYIRLTDIDGSGTTDIIYLGKNQFSCWRNLSGNSFHTEAFEIHVFPEIHNNAKVSVTDLLGNGVACIVWSSNLSKDAHAPLKYINLMNGKKPHIMVSYKNNLGKEVFLEYTPSTHFYLEDKKAGKPWVTKLHFPVHCVSKVEMFDRIRKTRFASEYTYHHGYYDHYEREFRGFGRVDEKDSEDIEHFIKQSNDAANNIIEHDLHQPPILTKTWFHTGAFLDRKRILNQFTHEYFQNNVVPENLLPEPELPDNLTIDEYRQALRACKGVLLRKEVYAHDGDPEKEKLPYVVEQHNSLIKILQPKGGNKYGVFLAHESEGITYHYERNPEDPRIAHSFILDVDKYGNVLDSASVVYEKISDSNESEQKQQHIIYSENQFTNDIQEPLDYRSPLVYFNKSFELTGLKKPDIIVESKKQVNYYTLDEIKTACNTATFIDYNGKTNPSLLQKRIIEFTRTQYRDDNTTTPLNFGVLQSKALVHQSYKAAFNQAMLKNVFEEKTSIVTLSALLTDQQRGAYIFEDGYYWVPSGTTNYGKDHFYLPTEHIDPFGNKTTVKYDSSNYYLFVQKVKDARDNEVSVVKFNYRTLSPYLMQDMNDNLTAVRFDELGMVVKSFIIGKKGIDKGDEFDDTSVEMKGAIEYPSLEMEYSVLEWYNQTITPGFDINNCKPKPNYVKTIAREIHYHENSETKFQQSYTYSDGNGQVMLTKVQAEPGDAWEKNENGSCSKVYTNTRCVGNGRVILNNKGNPVKQYEPYFSTTFDYDDESEMPCMGVTNVFYYDPIGRAIKTIYPNKTFSKVEFTPWQQKDYDANDTVRDCDWYKGLGSPDPATPEPKQPDVRAAWLAAKHHNTPSVALLDSLGRVFLTIEDKGELFLNKGEVPGDNKLKTRITLDIEGNQLEITDAMDQKVMQYQYDMLSHKIRQVSMDSGIRWMLNDVTEKPLKSWDSRNHEFTFTYDELHRPAEMHVTGGDGTKVLNNAYEKIVYGENQSFNGKTDKDLNIRGQVLKHYDAAGLITDEEYDFKGNLRKSSRRLAKDYKEMPDWSAMNPENLLEDELFISGTEYDALNRSIHQVLPHSITAKASEVWLTYNEGNFIETIEVAACGKPRKPYVIGIDYNEKGQRLNIFYGNSTKTRYDYDEKTFRLTRLLTTRKTGQDILQDLNYTYDPAGNITEIKDAAQQELFFNNAKVDRSRKYEYEAIYRLIDATGREHIGQNLPCDQFDNDKTKDGNGMPLTLPSDMNAMQRYEQRYEYDKAGNMLQMIHNAGNGIFSNKWTRTFEYNNDDLARIKNSIPSTTQKNNQLLNEYTGQRPATTKPKYSFDAHGNMLNLQEGSFNLIWNYADQLQQVNLGGGGTAYYVYDATGQRIRKVIENGATIKDRIYLGSYEVYREKEKLEGKVQLERETVHVMDDKQRIALVESRTIGIDEGLPFLIRYQYSNHLGSAILEMTGDEEPETISYEEHYPFGSTAYQAMKSKTEATKRYRYTGKERDEESGLNYHGARYYAPWLARWTSCDPLGIQDSIVLYTYSHNNPILFADYTGYQAVVVIFYQSPKSKPKPPSKLVNLKDKIGVKEYKELLGKYKKELEKYKKSLSESRHFKNVAEKIARSKGGEVKIHEYTLGSHIIDYLKTFKKSSIAEVHIVGHSGRYGIYSPEEGRGGLYTSKNPETLLEKPDIERGARTIEEIPIENLTKDVKIILYGCKTASKEVIRLLKLFNVPNISRAITEVLSKQLPRLEVWGRYYGGDPASPYNWIRYRLDEKREIIRESRVYKSNPFSYQNRKKTMIR